MVPCSVVKDYLVVSADEPLSKIIPKLKKEKQVIVFKGKKYCGIVTRQTALREGINLPELKIINITFKPPSIFEDTSELDIAKYFVETGAHFLPILNSRDGNKIDGVIYRTDFLKEVVLPYMKKIKVGDIANVDVKTILPENNLAKAVSMFHELGISKLIVYDKQVRGVLTLSNILGLFLGETQMSQSKLHSLLVKDVMKDDVIGVQEGTRIPDVINLFIDKNVSSVVVFDKNNLFGIITKTDVLEQYIYMREQELKQSSVQISAKFPGIDRKEIEDRFTKLEKFGKDCKVFVYYKIGKEKFRGLPLINCRVRLVKPKVSYNVSVEGWGIDHATELAIQKLKRQMGDVKF